MGNRAAYKADMEAAKEAAYRYVNNPFEEGTRRHKLCEKARAHKAYMDAMFEDLEEVYGYIGEKRPVINNLPGSTKGKLIPG